MKWPSLPCQEKKRREEVQATHLYPVDTDAALKQLLNGVGEEERDGEPHWAVQGHGDEDAAGRDGVAQQHVEGEGDEDDDLAGAEEGGHVEASQVGAFHDLGDLLAAWGGSGERRGLRGFDFQQNVASYFYFEKKIFFFFFFFKKS